MILKQIISRVFYTAQSDVEFLLFKTEAVVRVIYRLIVAVVSTQRALLKDFKVCAHTLFS